jgi:hypothetical protein
MHSRPVDYWVQGGVKVRCCAFAAADGAQEGELACMAPFSPVTTWLADALTKP